jgi:hypothetical protein
MQAGLSRQRAWPIEVRLLARAALAAGEPGRWTAPEERESGPVTEHELADLVSEFGGYDIICASTYAEAEAYDQAAATQRQRIREHLERAAELALLPVQRQATAQFFHEYDDQTRERHPHTHNIVIPAGALAAVG